MLPTGSHLVHRRNNAGRAVDPDLGPRALAACYCNMTPHTPHSRRKLSYLLCFALRLLAHVQCVYGLQTLDVRLATGVVAARYRVAGEETEIRVCECVNV